MTYLDNYADSCAVNRNDLILHYHEANNKSKYINILSYDSTLRNVRDMHVVNIDVVYYYPET